jgi:hypothetical protein
MGLYNIVKLKVDFLRKGKLLNKDETVGGFTKIKR